MVADGVCWSGWTGYMARYNASPARTAVGEYVDIAHKYGLTPTQLALAWCHQRPTVTCTIIGATTAEQLKVCLPEICFAEQGFARSGS